MERSSGVRPHNSHLQTAGLLRLTAPSFPDSFSLSDSTPPSSAAATSSSVRFAGGFAACFGVAAELELPAADVSVPFGDMGEGAP